MIVRPKAGYAVKVRERSEVVVVRRYALLLARLQSFDEETEGKLALIVTEAATNLVIHAGGGEMLLTAVSDGDRRWIDVLCVDRGPGIVKLGLALTGGHSTKGGLGEGLGAIRRLSHAFEIFAPPGAGTTIASRLYAERPADDSGTDAPAIGAVRRGKGRRAACGDGWGFRRLRRGRGSGLLLVADGVGHGSAAQVAAERALDTLERVREPVPAGLLSAVHKALAATRGAAAAAVLLDPAAGELTFCGIGNVSATVITAEGRRGLASLNGTLGHGAVELQQFRQEWPEGALLVLHTDGISTRWNLQDYPGLRLRHPALISGILYRDHAYEHDDATALVVGRRRRG